MNHINKLSEREALDLGLEQARQGNFNAALLHIGTALTLRPTWLEAHLNLGAVLLDLGKFQEALPHVEHVASKLYDSPVALGNYAVCLYRLGRFAEAENIFRKVIFISPTNYDMHYNFAFCLLAQCRLEEGWGMMSYRKLTKNWHGREPFPGKKYWSGEPLDENKVLIIFHEQGFGDSIMLSRYLLEVKKLCKNFYLICPEELARLFRKSFDIRVFTDVNQAPEPAFQCSLFDLPNIFHVSETNIRKTPYLSSSTTREYSFVDFLPGKKVGIVWAGEKRSDYHASVTDSRRSISLEMYAPLFKIPGTSFVSLQKGSSSKEVTNTDFPIHDWTDRLQDFADTAGLISKLDLVISVDTAVAHLSAALGKPTWLLNRFDPCWRWAHGKSIWYDALKEFRQAEWGNWSNVISNIKETLEENLTRDR